MTAAEDLTNFTDLTSQGVSPDAIPITGDDANDLVRPVRALRATGAGNIIVRTPGGGTTNRTLAFLAGETRYVAVTRVLATGTTATGIEGMP